MSEKKPPSGTNFGVGPRQPGTTIFVQPLRTPGQGAGASVGPRQPKAPGTPTRDTGHKK
jgi:hypothetical protein